MSFDAEKLTTLMDQYKERTGSRLTLTAVVGKAIAMSVKVRARSPFSFRF